MGALEDIEGALERASAAAGGAVVGIGPGWGLGTGVVVGEGLVLTNAHNVHGGEVGVSLPDGTTVAGRLAGVDVDGDLAVIAADTGTAAPITWAPAEAGAAVGRAVVALANPGGRGLRITFGTVAAVNRAFRGPRGRRVTGTFEHTAPMVRGSSGGPVVDTDGRFLGINTNRLGEGFYAAIPADAELRARVDALARGESPARRQLGVALLPGRAARHLRRSVGLPERDGLLIQSVEPGSPAAAAGLRQGDLIVGAGGRPVVAIDDLHQALDALGEGESLALEVVRGTDELAVTIGFGAGAHEEGTA